MWGLLCFYAPILMSPYTCSRVKVKVSRKQSCGKMLLRWRAWGVQQYFFVFVLKGCKLQGQARGGGTHILRRKQRGNSKFKFSHKVDGNTCAPSALTAFPSESLSHSTMVIRDDLTLTFFFFGRTYHEEAHHAENRKVYNRHCAVASVHSLQR